jgi:hypothetical protein
MKDLVGTMNMVIRPKNAEIKETLFFKSKYNRGAIHTVSSILVVWSVEVNEHFLYLCSIETPRQ